MHYPNEFPRNQWCLTGHAADVTDRLLSRTILDDLICLYRRADGEPAALIDHCLHRQMPLSMGRRVDGDAIECSYHGVPFDSDGHGTRIPDQKRILSTCRVRSYPVVGRGASSGSGWGDPDPGDPTTIPDSFWLTDDKWATVSGSLHVRGGAQILKADPSDRRNAVCDRVAEALRQGETAGRVGHDGAVPRATRPARPGRGARVGRGKQALGTAQQGDTADGRGGTGQEAAAGHAPGESVGHRWWLLSARRCRYRWVRRRRCLTEVSVS